MPTPKPKLQPTPLTPLRKRTLEIARGYVRKAPELPAGSNFSKVIAVFQKYIGLWAQRQPWCAAFASYCIGKAAKELGVKLEFARSASSSAIFSEAALEGRVLLWPEPGCIGLVRNGGRAGHNRPFEHTYIVEDVVGSRVKTIEGNWRSNVSQGERTITSKLVFVRIA